MIIVWRGCLFGAYLAVVAAGDPSQEQSARFKITTKRSDDRVEVQAAKDRCLFSVDSPFGISQAVIERQEASWPESVVLRLHLKGLSNFRASNGKVRLDASAGIQDGKPQVRVWKDGKEDVPLDRQNPLWTDIRIVSGDGKPAKEVPLKGGYFEIALPKAFFEGNPKAPEGDHVELDRLLQELTGRWIFWTKCPIHACTVVFDARHDATVGFTTCLSPSGPATDLSLVFLTSHKVTNPPSSPAASVFPSCESEST